jgi:RNA polymerase sigma-70 factor, ECF subfamily
MQETRTPALPADSWENLRRNRRSGGRVLIIGRVASATVTRDERFCAEALPHLRSLYGTAYRMTRNAHDAEDLVQETCLRAYRAFDQYEAGTNIRAWLFTILYRLRADAVRKLMRGQRTVELEESDLPTVAPAQDALASGGEDVARALASLPESFRTAVVLRDMEEFSYDEIARILQVPIGTVMSRIHRGRALLRSALTPSRANA